LKEFRIWNEARTAFDIERYAFRSIVNTDLNLAFYVKFASLDLKEEVKGINLKVGGGTNYVDIEDGTSRTNCPPGIASYDEYCMESSYHRSRLSPNAEVIDYSITEMDFNTNDNDFSFSILISFQDLKPSTPVLPSQVSLVNIFQFVPTSLTNSDFIVFLASGT